MKRLFEIDLNEKRRILRLHEDAKQMEGLPTPTDSVGDYANVRLFKFEGFRPNKGIELKVDTVNRKCYLTGTMESPINPPVELVEMKLVERNPYQYLQNDWIDSFSQEISFDEQFLFYPSYSIGIDNTMRFGIFKILKPELKSKKSIGWTWHREGEKYLPLDQFTR
jgi:hypothetical protein